MNEAIFVTIWVLLHGGIGGWLARNRGLNMFVWGALSVLFPIFIMIVYFKKPEREVPGGFRKCRSCGEFYPWKDTACTYCGTGTPQE